jgi:hypothetical protein
VVHDGVLAGSVGTAQGRFQIRYKGASGYAIQEIDTSALPPELEPIPTAPAKRSIRRSAAADDGSVIDVMVVYTPAARMAAGGAAGMQALITLGETETNIAYFNSQILSQLNVVHTEEVPYGESGSLSTDLSRLSGTDGFMDNVHALRDTHSADLVKLIVESGDGCGIAYLMPGNNPLFAPMAFSVTLRSCVSPNYTFAHELGHNEGSNHAPGDPTGFGAYSYSFGYKNPSNLFRTIMAYNCSGGGCPRVLHFSNPGVNFLGNPTGTFSQNNALSIHNVRTTVANFRSSSGTCPTAVALAGQPEAQNVRRALYGFRDRVLSRSRSGKSYTKLFYRYSSEMSLLLTKHEDLRLETRLLLLRLAPSIEAAASGGDAALSREDLKDASRLLDAFAARGSLSLKLAIWWFRPRLTSRPSIEEFGFDVAGRAER